MRHNNELNTRLSGLLMQIRGGASDELADAVGQAFSEVVVALPSSLRDLPIDAIKWSQPFATNAWWKRVWGKLRVNRVRDLARVGRVLAQTRGIGRTKLYVLIQDLVAAGQAARAASDTDGQADGAVETIRRSYSAIAEGPPIPPAHVVQDLFRSVLRCLPAPVHHWELSRLPWTVEWLYTTQLWKALGITRVGELEGASIYFGRVRGIGKGKILALAKELAFLEPELYNRLRTVLESAGSARGRRAAGGRTRRATGGLVAAIDRMADRLSPRDRDVLRRRIGWRYDRRPETLRTLAEEHGVTQERIRQIEQQIRKRLLRLLRLRNVRANLAAAIRGRSTPLELTSLVAEHPAEFQGIQEVWRPVATLLAAEGGPSFAEDPRAGDRVIVTGSRPGGRPKAAGPRAGRPAAGSRPAWSSRPTSQRLL